MSHKKLGDKKVILLILDGWGTGENNEHNAIFQTQPKFWNELLKNYPNTVLHAKEESVGLPKGCLSGSEVGHMTMGAGRIIYQNAAKIDNAIETNTFKTNPKLEEVKKHLTLNKGILHLAGLFSDGGIHSHINHIIALVEWAKDNNLKTAIHLFLDGRDMAPKSARKLLETLKPHLSEGIRIATMTGRAIAMDRSENWDRTTTVYKAMTEQDELVLVKPEVFLDSQYSEEITDEFIQPTRFSDDVVKENDAVIFFNFRADRMRQLVRLLTKRAPHTVQNTLQIPSNLYLASLIEYDKDFTNVAVLFPNELPLNTIGEWVSKKGLKQFRVAETEKYAHITYFFNGGREDVFPGEERLVVPSLGLMNYASNPEMSLPEVTNSLLRVIERNEFSLIVCNIANGDMVGHSGDMTAAATAVQLVDKALSSIVPKAEELGYTMVITADHGNIESMWSGEEPHTAHTFNHVPLVITKPGLNLPQTGYLNQIAPTILALLGLDQPQEMTSQSLI